MASTALVKREPTWLQQTLQRMIGFSAGLPQGPMLDPTLKTTGVIPLRGEAPTAYQQNGTTVRIRGFERHPVVMACVRAIVDIASAVPLQWYRLEPGQERESVTVLDRDFPGVRVTDMPNTYFSSQRFMATTFTHYLIYGNGLWFLERPEPSQPNTMPKEPTSLRLVHPEDVLTVYVNNKGYPIWYLWKDILGYPHTSSVTDLVHFRDLNAKGFVFGYPRAASALNDIIGDDEASQHVREVVTNSGMPPAYAIVNEETTIEEAKKAEESFFEKMVRRGNRGRMVFMGGIKDVKSVGFNLKDLEFPDLRRVAREDICAAFGVDPRMVGITSASRDAGLSGTQYTEARTRLIQQTIEPMLKAFESELNFWFAPEFGDVYVRFDPDALAALVEDHDATSVRVTRETQAGLRTIEEGRAALDMDPEFAATDTLIMPMTLQVVPVSIAIEGESTVNEDGSIVPPEGAKTLGGRKPDPANEKDLAGTTGLDPNNPKVVPKITDGSPAPAKKRSASAANGTDEAADPGTGVTPPSDSAVTPRGTVERSTKEPLKKVAPPQTLVVKRSIVLPPEHRQMLWQQFDTRATNEEAAYKRSALLLFAEERANVARTFERADDAQTAKRQLRLAYKTGGEVENRWTDRFHPLVGETFAKGAEHVLSGLRSATRAGPKKGEHAAVTVHEPDYVFHVSDPDVQAAIRRRTARLAEQVTETTAESIMDAISIGVDEGMGMSEIAKLVDATTFGTGASYRSTMIARTETVGALNDGQYTAAIQSEVIEGKEWLTQGDDKVRDSHAECENEGMVGIRDEFGNGMQHPGDEDGDADETINCRCTLLYYDTLTGNESEDDGGDGRATIESIAARVVELLNAGRAAEPDREPDRMEQAMTTLIASVTALAARGADPVVIVLPNGKGKVIAHRNDKGEVTHYTREDAT